MKKTIQKIKAKFSLTSDRELGEFLGCTRQTIGNHKKGVAANHILNLEIIIDCLTDEMPGDKIDVAIMVYSAKKFK